LPLKKTKQNSVDELMPLLKTVFIPTMEKVEKWPEKKCK
jgi:hypothetical protein